MGLRVLSYEVEIWNAQRREWQDRGLPRSQWLLHPVIPIVFYTGRRRWSSRLGLDELMHLPEPLRQFIPAFDILFLNLRTTDPTVLREAGSAVAMALRGLQASDGSKVEVAAALAEAARGLELLPDSALPEIRRALYYLYLMIRHTRPPEETADLAEVVAESVERLREEAREMRKTAAEIDYERGKQETTQGFRNTLLTLLEERFGPLSEATRESITRWSPEQIQNTFARLIKADSLAELGIPG